MNGGYMAYQIGPHAMPCTMSIVQAFFPEKLTSQYIQGESIDPCWEHRTIERYISFQN